jgi:phage-related baseplate assembly protein
MLALSDLFKRETREEVMSTLLTIAGDVALKVTAWQEGQPFRSLLTYVSQKMSDSSTVRAEAIKGGLLDYATEGWLTLLARSLYRVERNLAQQANGDSFVFTNDEAEEHIVAPGDLIVAHSVTGKTYANVDEVTIPASGSVEDVVMFATEAGTASDAGPDMITEMVTPIIGVTVTNVRAVLGADDELDPDLRARCRNKLGSLSPNGPKEAYAYVATTPYFPDGTACAVVSVPVTRTLVVTDPLTGDVTVYLATASGAPIGDDVDIVDAALDKWATPWCVTSEALAASEVVVPVTCHVWVTGSSLTDAQIQAKVSVAIAAFFRSVPISGYLIDPAIVGSLLVEGLRAAITLATAGIVQVTIALPAGDVELEEGEVATLGAVTTTVTAI